MIFIVLMGVVIVFATVLAILFHSVIDPKQEEHLAKSENRLMRYGTLGALLFAVTSLLPERRTRRHGSLEDKNNSGPNRNI